MNIKKTSKFLIALVAGATLVKTLIDDKLKKQEMEVKEQEVKEN